MTNKELPQQGEVVTRENLPSIIAKIAEEREKKGRADTLIPYIQSVRESADKLGEASVVVQLYQEEFLAGQHILMEEKSKRLKANPFRVVKGLMIMESTTTQMDRYSNLHSSNIDPVINARVNRFLGKYAEYKGNYKKSEAYYRKGLSFFESAESPEARFNILEFKGFLSYSLLKQGKLVEGTDLVKQTLKDFDESEEGKWLKENNYYAWAVWKSGIEIRTAEHLIKKNGKNSAGFVHELLDDAGAVLKMPDGNTEIFQLRLDELSAATGRLAKAGL